jgi:uncharacterized membrane protein
MGKSVKHVAITGMTTSKSEKKDKREAHKKLRRRQHVIVHELEREEVGEDIDVEIPVLDDVSNKATFSKDGKQYIHKSSPFYKKALRK